MKQLGVILLLPLDEMLTSPSQGYPKHWAIPENIHTQPRTAFMF